MKKKIIYLFNVILVLVTISSCSSTTSNKSIGITSHTHSYSSKVVEPTCTEQGYTLFTCVNGDDYYKDNYKNALGHSFTEGEKNFLCTRCGKSEADGFTFKQATMDGEACYAVTGVNSTAVINGILNVPRKYESLPVRGIMNWSFSSVTKEVKKVLIHDNIKNIFSDLWHGTGIYTPDWETMSSLEEIVFDSTCSDMRIEAGAFNNCPKLAKVNITKGMIKYAPADAVTTENGGTAEYIFKGTPYFKNNTTIKNGLYYIADLLLYANLNEISSTLTIDNDTIWINPCIFNKCTFLKSVIIPNSVTFIGKSAFLNCSNLETINFCGTISQFKEIFIEPSAFSGIKAKSITCTDGTVTSYKYNGYTYNIGN